MRLRPSDSRKKSSSSTITICGGGSAALSMLIDELLKAALWPLLDTVIASDFIMKSSHHLVLEVEVEVQVDLTVGADVAPDRRRRRLRPGARLAEPLGRGAFVEPDHLLRVDRGKLLRWPDRLRGRSRLRHRRLARRPRRGRFDGLRRRRQGCLKRRRRLLRRRRKRAGAEAERSGEACHGGKSLRSSRDAS